MLPVFPVPGDVIVALTPLGRLLTERETLPVKLVRVRLTVTLCALPPRASVTELGFTLLMAITGAAFTVKVKLLLTEETPLPLAVMVIDWLLTSVALLAAVRLMLPEFPEPGEVIVALTPLGRLPVASVTLPVKLVRVRLTVTLCALPP
jgi:hypothetical protein